MKIRNSEIMRKDTMRKQTLKLGMFGTVLMLGLVSGSTALALPSQANVHAMAAAHSTTTGSVGSSSVAGGQVTASAGSSIGSDHAAAGQAKGQSHLAAAQLRACNNRQAAIKNIMTRIDTRAQNQISLFGTIATRVEIFYVSKGKTFSNYNQLVLSVNAAKAQAETDFGTLRVNSSFSCGSSNPKSMVLAFQGYLKTEISDLRNYRTSVKNLIVGVASANGLKVSGSNTQGGQ